MRGWEDIDTSNLANQLFVLPSSMTAGRTGGCKQSGLVSDCWQMSAAAECDSLLSYVLIRHQCRFLFCLLASIKKIIIQDSYPVF